MSTKRVYVNMSKERHVYRKRPVKETDSDCLQTCALTIFLRIRKNASTRQFYMRKETCTRDLCVRMYEKKGIYTKRDM